MGKSIQLKNIKKSYGPVTVLKNINIDIEAGERIVLLGPSGSGKSTLLRMIAGLETITEGDLYLGDLLANDLVSGQRDIAMVFQNYALYPHMTIEENVTFALKANGVPADEVKNRLDEALSILGLSELKNRYPRELSGGQRQRTALARAIVKKSDFFLLDEPLSNLDVVLRLDARKELVKIHEKYQQTFIYVTHDQMEAMTLAHRIVVLHNGDIQMVDTPHNVYNQPANVFTAKFIGSPGMNILKVDQGQGHVGIDTQAFDLDPGWADYLSQAGACLMGIRPEHLRIVDKQERGRIKGQVKYRELLGQSFALTVNIGQQEFIVLEEEDKYQAGDSVILDFDDKNLHFFDNESQVNLGYPENFQFLIHE
ncbi:ABC transporter ATP-binding protein [Eremococcus coleocola]|uniref:ABC transporter, ATP-binding protein n=1 Tax=Eremococcus coleocola ACS-139-V-Col8 TaxID=908337 RepID=E4KM84_9LACT|nr:ABC transporter ATP-binding protein [Eremococcus coleocola]EFR32066.1 ABC transporter, ATP-binding protein [Eremococcus coleocola ACS-139-V-Col8]